MDNKRIEYLYHKLDKKLSYFENNIGLRKPINLNEEKIKFFNSNYKYNPQFLIPKTNLDDFKWIKSIDISDIPDSDIKSLYLNKIEENKNRFELLNNLNKNDEKVCEFSKKLYGVPSEECYEVAKKIIAKLPKNYFIKKKTDLIRFKSIKRRIRSYLKKNKFPNKINALFEPNIANYVSVSKKNGRLNITKNYIADSDEVIDVIYHEIETHIRRFNNGAKHKYGIFKFGTAGYLHTEEGLAPIMGHSYKKNKIMYHPAILIYAIHNSLNSDFVTVFKKLNTLIRNPFQSWTYTLRSKSAISDTSKPLAYTKDLYLQWAMEVGRELINHNDYIKYAFNGKASLSELEKYTHPNHSTKIITAEGVNNILDINFINK